jgi:nitrile hydratase
MNGVHDLGGRDGFGAVERTDAEQAFHERWEAAVFTMANVVLAARIAKNVDHFRHAIERIDPVSYLSDTYYGRWLGGVETLLVEAGVVASEDLNTRTAEMGGDPEARVAARPDRHPDVFPESGGDRPPTAERPGGSQGAFSVGDQVRTSKASPHGHTRLPAYARGAVGEIVAVHGAWVFPDSNAHGRGENPEPLYTVRFAGAELWGEDAEDDVAVHLDLFESYLESP